ncbi:transcription antitermination factor NusB [bacterium]|jgi:N utilization substance protein B|nr:transcription antitermination factor NusB [bacterium]NBO36540.1 transcription antitermination factor NusB [bacterium]
MINRSDKRHNSRILALVNLFSYVFSEEEDLKTTLLFREEVGNLDYDNDLYQEIYNGVINNLSVIDRLIEEKAPDWPISNIPKIDLTILRIAIFELVISQKNEPAVIIDESIEVAKEFGSENSSKFIHGVLGAVSS